MEILAKKINEEIKNSKLYKEYLVSKKRVEEIKELSELLIKMKALKNENCKSKDEKLIEEYYALEKRYNDHVLVKEYSNKKKDLGELFKDISDILSFK